MKTSGQIRHTPVHNQQTWLNQNNKIIKYPVVNNQNSYNKYKQGT